MASLNPRSIADRPIIYMIESESETITAMALGLEKRNPAVAELLFAELNRAELLSPLAMPPETVTMNCKVEFVDQRSRVSRSVELVYPKDADIEQGRISILTPMGAGLIGMTAGESIAWPDRSGEERILTIVSVTPPAVAPIAA